MGYAGFLLTFVVPPVVLLALTRSAGVPAWKPLLLIAGAALVYTTPWDNYLVARGVWGYGAGRVIGVIGYVPVEEYAFFVLQPLLVGLLFLRLRHPKPGHPHDSPTPPIWLAGALVAGWLAVAAAGAGLILLGPDDALYAGLILAWAAPALAGLSAIGTRHLWANLRPALFTLGIASAYLWTIDRVAIGLGIWSISPRYSLGEVAGLPVEEALFFSITSWLCIHGLATMLPENAPAAPA